MLASFTNMNCESQNPDNGNPLRFYPLEKRSNGRMRDELLNETLFTSLDHPREKIAAWTWDYTPGGRTLRFA